MTANSSELLVLAGCDIREIGEGYAVTAAGDVWSSRKGAWVRLKPYLNNGYRRLSVKRGGQLKTVKVARLVCEAFHGPKPFAQAVVRHLDGSSVNDRPGNLAWGSYSENALDAVRHGTSTAVANGRKGALKLRGSVSHFARLSWDKVREIRRRRSLGEQLKRLADEFGVSEDCISRACLGRTWIEPDMVITTGMRIDG